MRTFYLAVLLCLLAPAMTASAADVGTKNWIGIGVIINKNADGHFEVLQVMPNSPARDAGIKVKDIILTVNDHKVDALTLSEILDLLRGEPNTTVNVTIERPGSPAPLSYTLKRKPMHYESPKPGRLD